MKLPRDLERDPQAASVQAGLQRNRKRLWEGGSLEVLWLDSPEALLQGLSRVDFRFLERGLENAAKFLEREQTGLAIARVRQGAPPAHRISRLVLISNDGSERFYRGVESLLLTHAERCIGIRLNVSAEELAQSAGREGEIMRFLLIADRGAVSQVLLSLAHSTKGTPAAGRSTPPVSEGAGAAQGSLRDSKRGGAQGLEREAEAGSAPGSARSSKKRSAHGSAPASEGGEG